MQMYCWITYEGERDISEDRTKFQISRIVIWTKETIKNKEQRLKEIPFCSMLDSLERELKERVNNILEEDDDCMSCIDIHNMD